MKKTNLIAVATTCFLLNTVAAQQSNKDIHSQINNSASLNVVGATMRYNEDNALLKSYEDNNIYGLAYDVRGVFIEHIYAAFYVDFYSDGVFNYDAAGPERDKNDPRYNDDPIKKGPIRIDSFFNTDIKLGYIFSNLKLKPVIPYVDIGYINRGIKYDYKYYNEFNNASVQNYKVTYQNYKALAGIMLQWTLLEDRFSLSPYIGFGKAFNINMKHDALGLNTSLGNAPIYEGGLEINCRASEKLFVTGFIKYTHIDCGTAKTQGVYYIPDNKLNQFKAGLGVRYSLM